MKTFKGFMAMAALYFMFNQGAAAQENKWYSKEPTDYVNNFRKKSVQEVAFNAFRHGEIVSYSPDSSLTKIVDSLQVSGIPIMFVSKYKKEIKVEGQECRIDVVVCMPYDAVVTGDSLKETKNDVSADSVKSIIKRENLQDFYPDYSLRYFIDSLQVRGIPVILANKYRKEIFVEGRLQTIDVITDCKDTAMVEYMIIREKKKDGELFEDSCFPNTDFEESYFFDACLNDMQAQHLDIGIDASKKEIGFGEDYSRFFKGNFNNEREKINETYFERINPIKIILRKEHEKLIEKMKK